MHNIVVPLLKFVLMNALILLWYALSLNILHYTNMLVTYVFNYHTSDVKPQSLSNISNGTCLNRILNSIILTTFQTLPHKNQLIINY